MRDKIIFIGVIVAIAIGVVALLFFKKPTEEKNFVKVKIAGVEIKTEIANTAAKKIKGLMFRESLLADEGMLFIYNNSGYHSIWMMNMRFPIDIIWLDASKKVVSIKKNVQPCTINCQSYRPSGPANYVLEVNAGFADVHKIVNGTVAEFILTSKTKYFI